jgi:hypothetical protein
MSVSHLSPPRPSAKLAHVLVPHAHENRSVEAGLAKCSCDWHWPPAEQMLLWSCKGRARQRTEHLPGDVALEAAEDLALE